MFAPFAARLIAVELAPPGRARIRWKLLLRSLAVPVAHELAGRSAPMPPPTPPPEEPVAFEIESPRTTIDCGGPTRGAVPAGGAGGATTAGAATAPPTDAPDAPAASAS